MGGCREAGGPRLEGLGRIWVRASRLERKAFGGAVRAAREAWKISGVSFLRPEKDGAEWRWGHGADAGVPLALHPFRARWNPSAHERLEIEAACADAGDVLRSLLEPRLSAEAAAAAGFRIQVSGPRRGPLGFCVRADTGWNDFGPAAGALDGAARFGADSSGMEWSVSVDDFAARRTRRR